DDRGVLPELHEVPALAVLPAHDTRPGDLFPGPLRLPPWNLGEAGDYLRPRADVLLPAAHPADPRRDRLARFVPLRILTRRHVDDRHPHVRIPVGLRREPDVGLHRVG